MDNDFFSSFLSLLLFFLSAIVKMATFHLSNLDSPRPIIRVVASRQPQSRLTMACFVLTPVLWYQAVYCIQISLSFTLQYIGHFAFLVKVYVALYIRIVFVGNENQSYGA